nr:hypothetical protein [Lentzea aerocolonigenes]
MTTRSGAKCSDGYILSASVTTRFVISSRGRCSDADAPGVTTASTSACTLAWSALSWASSCQIQLSTLDMVAVGAMRKVAVWSSLRMSSNQGIFSLSSLSSRVSTWASAPLESLCRAIASAIRPRARRSAR